MSSHHLPVRRLFLDTGVLIAAVVARDPHHDAATGILEDVRRWRTVHTSDHVIAEGLNYVRRKVGRRDVADGFLSIVFGTPEYPPVVHDVLRVHGGRFAAALARYRTEFDRGLSFTDWTSIVLMEEEGIDAIATFDGGFGGVVEVVDGG